MLEVQSVRIELDNGEVKTYSMERPSKLTFPIEMVEDLLKRLGVPVDGESPVEPMDSSVDVVWVVRQADEFVGDKEGRYCYVKLLCAEIKE